MTFSQGVPMKPIRIHKSVAREICVLGTDAAKDIADLLALLSAGVSIGMPSSRPMPTIASGVHELRIRDQTGIYRVFYYTKLNEAIWVFHFFKKKSEQTPISEIETAKKRLKEMLE